MSGPNLPDEVIRILSFHGPVELITGRGEAAATGKVHLAPFDDQLILLVPPLSRLVAGVLAVPDAQLVARAEDQRYTLRLVGRAVAGRLVSAHPARAAISPWLPEGSTPASWLAIPFVADEVELVKEEDQVRNRFAGPTPAGRALPPPWRRIFAAGFGQGGTLPLIGSLILVFLWFGYLGADQPLRPLGVLLAWGGAMGLIAGIRLLGQAAAFGKWLRGDGRAEDAPAIQRGWLSVEQARRLGLLALGVAALCLFFVVWMPNGAASVLVVVLASGSPLLALAWLVHGTVSTKEPGEG